LRFPIQVVAKSRTPEDHIKYYRWVHFITNFEYRYDDRYEKAHPVWTCLFGFRTRWFHTAMDLVPTVIWRHLPVRWQSKHLFGDLE
jgi:hypothetical protein